MSAKKILCSLLIALLLGELVPLVSATNPVDFNVKIATAGDETYASVLSNVSRNNTDITFQFVKISSGWMEEYSVSLPAGFSYVSSNTSGNSCANFSLLNASDGNYHFSFNGAASCLAKTEFTYRVTPSAAPGNAGIFVLGKNGSSWNSVADVLLAITATNSITKATTADLNANGYIDAYVLSFATSTGVTVSTLSGVTVAWVTVSAATASGSNWIIPFSDNILGTGDLPQVGGVFDGVTLTNSLINEEDGSRPRVMTIAGVAATGASLAIGTGTLTMGLSEPMSPSSTGSFSLKLGTGTIAGTMVLTGNLSTLVFTPTTPLGAGSYTLVNTTGATDWSAGANILSQTFPSLVVPDTTAPWTGSILINNGAATTTSQTVSLNLSATDNVGVTSMMISNSPTFSWAAWENYSIARTGWMLDSSTLESHTVYVRFRDLALNVGTDYSDSITIVAAPILSSGGGGGGPSPDYCPNGDRSWNFYDTKCDAIALEMSATATGTVTPVAPWIPVWSVSPSKLSLETIDQKYFSNFAESQKYLLGKISNRSIVRLINSYGDKLAIPDDAYFLSVDKSLYIDRNRTINSYVLLFLRVQDLVDGKKTSEIKNEAIANYQIVNDGILLAKNIIDRYVVRESLPDRNDIVMYRTKDPAIQRALWVLENRVLRKFDALRENGTITDEEYRISLQAYNDFVLHLSIYRNYGKSSLAKERALAAIKVFAATYRK